MSGQVAVAAAAAAPAAAQAWLLAPFDVAVVAVVKQLCHFRTCLLFARLPFSLFLLLLLLLV